jgi:hypothetical protein
MGNSMVIPQNYTQTYCVPLLGIYPKEMKSAKKKTKREREREREIPTHLSLLRH